MTRIHTAIIPAAGLGTYMRPATDAVPKELLPVGGHPTIDWVLHEAVAAGIDEVIVVTNSHKPEIEHYLAQACVPTAGGRGNKRPRLKYRFVTQAAPKGLGDAVRTGWRCVADEPVAVLLPDELMLGGASLLASLLEHHDRERRSIVALAQVASAEVGAYGCARIAGTGPQGTMVIGGFAEKPTPISAPSNYAICGRYLLGTEVLDALDDAAPDRTGEVQLTSALDAIARRVAMLGLRVLPGDGRIDVGNWGGWLSANVATLESGEQPVTAAYRLLHPERDLTTIAE